MIYTLFLVSHQTIRLLVQCFTRSVTIYRHYMSMYCWCIGWFDTVWFQVCFQLYGPVFSMPWYGYRYLCNCTLVSSTPSSYSLSDWVFLPEASFGLRVLPLPACVCVRLSVCLCVRPCVRQSWACPRDNSLAVKARITKFGPEMEKTLVKIP